MKHIMGAMTEVVDPKIYYSRFSFLESGKDAIDLKYKKSKRNMMPTSGSTLPSIKSKYNVRSTLVKNLIPQPSEGRVRALFGEGNLSLPRINKFATSRSPDRSNFQHIESVYETESKYIRDKSPAPQTSPPPFNPLHQHSVSYQ